MHVVCMCALAPAAQRRFRVHSLVLNVWVVFFFSSAPAHRWVWITQVDVTPKIKNWLRMNEPWYVSIPYQRQKLSAWGGVAHLRSEVLLKSIEIAISVEEILILIQKRIQPPRYFAFLWHRNGFVHMFRKMRNNNANRSQVLLWLDIPDGQRVSIGSVNIQRSVQHFDGIYNVRCVVRWKPSRNERWEAWIR